MSPRVTRRAALVVLAALATLTLTGCGRQVAQGPEADLDLLATGPDREALPVPPPYVAAAIDATGGLAAWMQCKKLQFGAVATAYQADGSFYLTEHNFAACPWACAMQLSCDEPRTQITCRIVDGQYHLLGGDADADTSPLSVCYRDYVEAVLQIATAPVRMLTDGATLLHEPVPVMIGGRWYHPIQAKYAPREAVSKGKSLNAAPVEPYWTQGIYFQDQGRSLVDMIWLANPAEQRHLVVRGYDYARLTDDGVLIPTKIEIFQSDADARLGRRLALIDLKR